MSLRAHKMWTRSESFNRRLAAFRETHRPTKQPFPFLKLPPELRLEIYEPLIQDGDLGILRASKQINREAMSLIPKMAILRMTLGRPNNNSSSNRNSSRSSRSHNSVTLPLTGRITLSGTLTLVAPDYIQHLNLRLDLIARPESPIDAHLIASFAGLTIPRKSCKITVMFGILGPIPARSGDKENYRKIGTLTGFRTLTLRLEYVRDAAYEAYLMRRLQIPPMINWLVRAEALLPGDYRSVAEILKGTLGPAEFDGSREGHCLRFRPRGFNERRGLAG